MMTTTLKPRFVRAGAWVPALSAAILALAGYAMPAGAATDAPASSVGAVPARDDALYHALGGTPGLTRIVADFYDLLLVDPRTKPYFEGAPIERIKTKLVEQLCVLAGGPCIYTGRDMRRAHAGQNIDGAAFNAVVEDLQQAMDQSHIPFRVQNRLLALLAPMHRDIQDRP